MIREVAAKRYAEAVLQIAGEAKRLVAWAADLQTIAAVLSHPQVAAMLESARMPTTRKTELVESLLRELDPLALNLARLLVRRGRVALAPQIAEAYQEMIDDERGVVHASVVTAVPLSDEEKQAVGRKLEEISGKQVAVTTETDPDIVGGLVARLGDRLIDGSTRTRLRDLKRRLEGTRI